MKIQYWIYLVLYLGFYTKGYWQELFSLYILSCLLFNFQGPICSRFSRQLGYYTTSHSDCQYLFSKFLIFFVFQTTSTLSRAHTSVQVSVLLKHQKQFGHSIAKVKRNPRTDSMQSMCGAESFVINKAKSGIAASSLRGVCVIQKLKSHFYPLFRSALFSRPAKGRDKIVWSTRFRRARRTSVRRAAKSGAEKAKTSNFMQESVRIPTLYMP